MMKVAHMVFLSRHLAPPRIWQGLLERVSLVYRPLLMLPWRVASFHLRARRVARRTGDEWSLASKTGLRDLVKVLELARGRRRVAEIGTGTAWTAIALALDDPRRHIVTYDPIVRLERDRYLALVDPATRSRIELVNEPGERGANGTELMEMVFIDSSHERAETISTFNAWRGQVLPGGLVLFHDYAVEGHPGVTEAIEELGLNGEVWKHFFIWRKPK